MQDRHTNREQYFDECAKTSSEYFIPFFRDVIDSTRGINVLEIGCGEGGNLYPFALNGCKVVGIDRSGKKISDAKLFFKQKNVSGEFLKINFFEFRTSEQFDIIIVNDVIEHICDKNMFFKNLNNIISSKTLVFWGFPAWTMPFGGHQQICKNPIVSKIPYIHLLPNTAYSMFLKLFKENDDCINELLDIKKCRISIEGFEKLCKENNHKVLKKKLWIINPHYKSKFGLAPISIPEAVANIKYIMNFISTGCFYITNSAKK